MDKVEDRAREMLHDLWPQTMPQLTPPMRGMITDIMVAFVVQEEARATYSAQGVGG